MMSIAEQCRNLAGEWYALDFADEIELGEAMAKKLQEVAELLERPAGVPDGWKLVPTEPSPEMVAAGKREYPQGNFTRSVYRAMLAAAPQPERAGNGEAV